MPEIGGGAEREYQVINNEKGKSKKEEIMKRISRILARGGLLILVFFIYGQIQPTKEWISHYNGPGDYNDRAVAISVDSSMNVYITGWSYGVGTGTDFATAKYDTHGNELWVARYNCAEGAMDQAYAIENDDFGNVYVSGKSRVGSQNYISTLKYDTNGNELWSAQYNTSYWGSYDWWEYKHSIAVDSSGNVYVVGRDLNYDIVTIKYDTYGNERWICKYGGPEGWDSGYAIAVDSNGNVYITGYSTGVTSNKDYVTIKYDTFGNELWIAHYNGPGNARDVAYAIALDSSGNVYVTGESGGAETVYDYVTVKYDTNGNELWVAMYDGPGDENGFAWDIAVDSLSNVYVTGESKGSQGSWDWDFATVKYDSHGNELWVARHNGAGNGWDGAYALALDSSGNVYVSGWVDIADDIYDLAILKYDTDGNQCWVIYYHGPDDNEDYAEDIAVDSSGNVYVTGASFTGTHHDFLTMKYSNPLISLTIDIKPDGYPNSINLGDHGLLPVAILGSVDFDVTEIDPVTIEIGGITMAERGSAKAPKLAFSFEDVNSDGYMDMMTFFEVQSLVIEGILNQNSAELIVTANLADGTAIEGTDSVNIVNY
jgi:uncharacterized delta-60 repeat protein